MGHDPGHWAAGGTNPGWSGQEPPAQSDPENDADRSWIFRAVSDEEADLAYKGGATPEQLAAISRSREPEWEPTPTVQRPTQTPGPGYPSGPTADQPTGGAPVAQPTSQTLTPPSSPGTASLHQLDVRPRRRPGTGLFVLVGAFVGLAVLAITWALFLRGASTSATVATPIRSVVVTPTPSVSASPALTNSPAATPSPSDIPTVTQSGTPTVTPSGSPSVSGTSAGGLNDAQNAKGWTFIIDGMGPVKVGMAASDAVKLGVLVAAPTGCSLYSPTEQLGATKVYARGEVVDGIDIRTPGFGSGRGLRVGSTLAELQSAYGKSLKQVEVSMDGAMSSQYALVNSRQFIVYVIADNVVSRIAIGRRGPGGSITLPPPAC